jgi:hypothetical protein
MLILHPNQHRSNLTGKVDSIVLFIAKPFPRSYERGSIEAQWLTTVRPSSPKTFPRSYERGSIEAYCRGVKTGTVAAAFPRSYERGSIEAARVTGFWEARAWFPRSYERGSIEAS